MDLRLDTLFSAFEMIASGVTTVQHLHSRAPGGVEDVVAASRKVVGAYRDIGMRASYSMALRDQNRLVYADDADFTATLPDALKPAMKAYFERFTLPLTDQVAIFDALRAELAGEERIALQLAPANLHWLSDEALALSAELSRSTACRCTCMCWRRPTRRNMPAAAPAARPSIISPASACCRTS